VPGLFATIELPVALPEGHAQVYVTFVSVEVLTALIVRVGGLHANKVPPVAVLSEKEIGAGATTFALSVLAQPKASCTVTE
jgi:hypothetical protein